MDTVAKLFTIHSQRVRALKDDAVPRLDTSSSACGDQSQGRGEAAASEKVENALMTLYQGRPERK